MNSNWEQTLIIVFISLKQRIVLKKLFSWLTYSPTKPTQKIWRMRVIVIAYKIAANSSLK